MSAADNRALLDRFYQAFQRFDAAAMNACYAPDVSFTDPVFGTLHGDRARGMWQMLAARSDGLDLTYELGAIDDDEGAARWIARYPFSATGRQVENHVTSHFWFANGLIAREVDTFDLWRWSRMALGLRGTLLGWTPLVQGAIRKQAATGLDRFLAGGT